MPHGRRIHSRTAEKFVIITVIRNATAGSTHREGRADNGGQTDIFQCLQCNRNARSKVFLTGCVFGCSHNGRLGIFDAQPIHRFAEQLAVLGHLDGFALGTDHLDAEFFQYTHFLERERGVQAGLAAHGGKQRVGAFLFDDLRHDLGCDRFDIGSVRKAGVGHDRRRVGVDQDDAVAFFLERFAGLRA